VSLGVTTVGLDVPEAVRTPLTDDGVAARLVQKDPALRSALR